MLAFAKLTSIHTLRKLIKPPDCPNACLPFCIACKVALINGGGSGIGFAIAGQILMEGAKHVVISGNDCDQGTAAANVLNEAFGKGKACYIYTDVNNKEQLDVLFRTTMHQFGQIDCVVNSVGMFDGENWECELMTNLVSTIRSNVLSYRYMSFENQGCGGVVLNIAGIHGFDVLSCAPTLCAAHHGLVGLTRSFGHPRNNKRSGLRFLTLCPGITTTNFLKDSDRKAMSDEMGNDMKRYLGKAAAQNPDAVGTAAVHLIQCAESGSVWVCDDCKLYHMEIPKRIAFSVLERDLV